MPSTDGTMCCDFGCRFLGDGLQRPGRHGRRPGHTDGGGAVANDGGDAGDGVVCDLCVPECMCIYNVMLDCMVCDTLPEE